jgi:ketosteroid isomerase-like protein
MSTPRTPSDVFLALVHGVAAGRAADLPALYAEHTHVEHPFHPLRPPPLHTRDELRAHFTGGGAGPALRREPVDIRIHQTADPEVIVAEFAYAGTNLDTGESFRIPAIFVLRVRDGEIVESRDYFDHVAAACARGQLGDLLAELSPRASW